MHALKSSKNSHRIAEQFLRHYRFLSQRSCRLSFGESLGGSQAPLSFWEVPGLPRKFPEVPRKFFGDFPGSSLTVELNSNPEVPRKFPKLPWKFPRLPRKFPDFPGGQPLSLGSLTPSPDSQKLSLNCQDRRTIFETLSLPVAKTGKIKTYTGTSPSLFSKKAMPWGKKWPVQMNLLFFRCKSICTGGGPESGRKKFEECLPAGTGTKNLLSLTVELNSNPEVPRKFPKLPRKFPRLPRKFPDFPGGQPLSLGSLTPSPDSQKLSLNRIAEQFLRHYRFLSQILSPVARQAPTKRRTSAL